MKVFVFTFFSLMVTTAMATAGQLTSENNAFCQWKFTGQIEKGDADLIDKIPTGTIPTRLCLDSPGGSLSEGLKLFNIIWEGNLTTAVLPGDRCESACAIAFLAGSTLEGTDVTRQMDRIMWVGSRLGFHGPSLGLQSDQTYQDQHLNTAFKTALNAAARLFEVNRTQDRGSRAMTDHLLHRWLNTDPRGMYHIDTVGDAILSDIPVGGVNFDLKLRTDHIRNICDNVYLKGSYPAGYGLSGTIHHDFTNTSDLQTSLDQDYFSEDRRVFAEIRNNQLVGFVGAYHSSTKYHVNGCYVTFDLDSVARFKAEDYYMQSTPINVKIVAYTEIPEDGTDVLTWAGTQDLLQERSLDPIYLFPFDMSVRDLPRNEEHAGAKRPEATFKNDREASFFVSMRFLYYHGRDLPGGDIGTLKTTDINECATACIQRTDCIGYTEDRWNGLCYLKGQGAASSAYRQHPKAATHMRAEFAGQIADDPRPVVMKGRKGKGFDAYVYETLQLGSYDSCATACLNDDRCRAINYRAATASCEKIANPPEYFTMEGVEMGIKVQAD